MKDQMKLYQFFLKLINIRIVSPFIQDMVLFIHLFSRIFSIRLVFSKVSVDYLYVRLICRLLLLDLQLCLLFRLVIFWLQTRASYPVYPLNYILFWIFIDRSLLILSSFTIFFCDLLSLRSHSHPQFREFIA